MRRARFVIGPSAMTLQCVLRIVSSRNETASVWKGKFFTWCLEKGEKGGEKLKAKAGRGLPLALLLFVGIPLPGTGAWTGTLAASILDMDFKTSVLAIMGGVLLASVIMLLASSGVFGAIGALLA